MTRKQTNPVAIKVQASAASSALVADLRRLNAEARQSVATTVNAGPTLLYWRIGKRIVDEVLGKARAAYGQQIVVSLARKELDALRVDDQWTSDMVFRDDPYILDFLNLTDSYSERDLG